MKVLISKVINFTNIWMLGLIFAPLIAYGNENDSIVNRPYKLFDVTAFCSYQNYHPSQYIKDNNWDILCAFRTPGPISRLDSLHIPYNMSQLQLLKVGDLVSYSDGILSTNMPIFDKAQTSQIRTDSKEFADSIFPIIEPDIKELISVLEKDGYSKQIYSIVFSYLLDHYIWNDSFLTSTESCIDHGSWQGDFWAMYYPRDHVKIGTNSYGPFIQNWTDDLGYWLSSSKMSAFAKELVKNNGKVIENKDVVAAVDGWGLTDGNGNILIPVIHANSNDDIDVLCRKINTTLSDAVRRYCASWHTKYNIASEKSGQIIFYHEVMWDLLDLLEAKCLISMPPILKGEEVGKEHFGDICIIVVGESED